MKRRGFTGGAILGRMIVGWAFVTALVTSLAGARDRGIGEPLRVWTNRPVRVCVANAETRVARIFQVAEEVNAGVRQTFAERFDAWPSDILAGVRQAVESAFPAAEVGISFVGWEACEKRPALSNTDVILIPFQQVKKRPTDMRFVFGDADIGPMEKRPSVIFLDRGESANADLALQLLQMTAVHEFGHLAGLRHEHLAREADDLRVLDNPFTDAVCEQLTLVSERSESPQIAAERLLGSSFTTYDRASIMSYCFTRLIVNAGNPVNEKVANGVATLIDRGSSASLFGGKSLAYLGYFLDETNSRIRMNHPSVDGVDVHYEFFPKLSAGDRHALRCLYSLEPLARCQNLSIESLRPYSGRQSAVKISLPSEDAELLKSSFSKRESKNAVLLFADGQPRWVPDADLTAWKTKAHCRVKITAKTPRKWLKTAHRLPLERKDSELGKTFGVGNVDLEAGFGEWICSSDLERGVRRLDDAGVRVIFGARFLR